MPGDDLHKVQKAATLGVDCVCLDMEDGTALNRKAEARRTIAAALRDLDFGRSERLARINAVGSGLEEADLAAVIGAGPQVRPDGIVTPKLESPEQVKWVCSQIDAAEARYGWPAGGIALLIQIESALGVVHIQSIVSADPRIQAVIFGAEDFAASIGALRTPEAWEVFYARSAVVTHAAAQGLQALDMVYVNFRDPDGLRAEAQQGARMGYTGKQIIHPSQVAPVQETFTPSDEAVAHAQRVMLAYAENLEQGRGAFALDGKMVDMPIIKAAQRILDLARAAGKPL